MTRQINYRIKVIGGIAIFQAYCPYCGKTFKVQKDNRTQWKTSIGAHLMDAHEKHKDEVITFVDACRSIMRREKTERRIKEANDIEAARIESERQAKLRFIAAIKRSQATITLTSSDVDEIQSELQTLIDMMEPYYSQGNCDADARGLIQKLEDMLTSAS